MVGRKTTEVRHDIDENAFEALVMERPGEMVVVNQVTLPFEASDHRHHVRAEEFGQVARRLHPPGVALPLNLLHPHRDLGRPQAQNGRRVENRFAKAHRIAVGFERRKMSQKCLIRRSRSTDRRRPPPSIARRKTGILSDALWSAAGAVSDRAFRSAADAVGDSRRPRLQALSSFDPPIKS